VVAFAVLSPLLLIAVTVAPRSDRAMPQLPAPKNHQRLISRSKMRHTMRTAVFDRAIGIAADYDSNSGPERRAGRAAIFPPDGALDDALFSSSSISLSPEDDAAAPIEPLTSSHRPAGQVSLPGSPARGAFARGVLDNLGRILGRLDRDARPRVHR
jgi:hypothetical protein